MPAPTKVDWNGEQRLLNYLARENGLMPETVRYRLQHGWSLVEAITTRSQKGARRIAAPAAQDAIVCASRPDMPCGYDDALGTQQPAAPAEIQPIRCRPVLPRGTVAAVADAAEILEFVADLLQAPETLPLRRADLLERCRGWLQRVRGGAA
jgi:hypothetical protein